MSVWNARYSVVEKQSPIEQFEALSNVPNCRHIFTRRIPGIEVVHDKTETLRRLEAAHLEIRRGLGVGDWPLLTAQQIHGNKIAVVDEVGSARCADSRKLSGRRGVPTRDKHFAGCDGLITTQCGVALGIHVADCCAIYLVDPKTPAIGLVHSGKKGTELAVVTNVISQMSSRFGTKGSDLIVQLSPCIRPPHYEVDFAAKIIEQCRAQGVAQIYDSGVCTACHLDLYYSYRAEKGRTGRMLALLGMV